MIKKLLRLRRYIANWYLRPIERMGLWKGDITYRLHSGLRFTFAARALYTPLWILEDMLYHDLYNDKRVLLGAHPVVIDVGANCGIFSVLQAHRFSDAVVHAYEPDPDNFRYLKKNIKDNLLDARVYGHNVAVIGKLQKEKLRLYHHEQDAGSHSTARREQGDGDYVEVESETFASVLAPFIKTGVDFLKMDCEGAEYDILMNTAPEVLSRIKYCALEYHEVKGATPQELKAFMTKNDFYVEEYAPHIFHCFNVQWYPEIAKTP